MPVQIVTPPSDESLLAFIHSLPAYDTSEGVDRLLDVTRRIILDGGYVWVGYAFPQGVTATDLTLQPGQTLTGTLSIPQGSIIYAINADSTSTAGIRLRIYDKSARSDISSGRFLYDKIFAGSSNADANSNSGDPTGPGFLHDPLFVMGPTGSLQIDMVNADPTNSAIAQVLFCCAVPINNQTANTPVIG